jgi:NAD(P)-dependent dehydrogenase (short-subunit alcohol dehydrogenase family)
VNGLEGKVAIVAGGASGLGKATSVRLGAEGALVAVADINVEAAEIVAEKIRSDGGTAEAFYVDLADEAKVNALVAATVERFGGVQLLHNVAYDPVHVVNNDHDILSTSLESFDRMHALTQRGYVLACRAVLPHMLGAGGGAIVNTSSLAAIQSLEAGNRYSYSMAKSGLSPLSQHICTKFGAQGIRCNTVLLGLVLSEGLLSTLTPERIATITKSACVLNPGEPEAIAAAVAFLLSDDARIINGQSIHVDGGSSAHL